MGILLGKLKLKSNLILAPMAGVADLPFRLLNRKFGCELAFIEMINCRSLSHKSRRTQDMLRSDKKDRPLGIQLLGSEEKFILRAIEVLNVCDFDLLDFNAACPVKKVVARGEGASLLKRPRRINKLLKTIVQHSRVPVTIKIRTGWDRNSVNAKEVALSAQEAGISGLFIHGRTKTQGYSGEVDYDTIRRVKKASSIPIVASGNGFSAELVKRMFDETGCDGVAIARGALGNPWIFKECREFLKTGKPTEKPAKEQIIRTMIEHLNSCLDFYGERIGIVKFRKFFIWYTKGLCKIRPLRERVSGVKTRLQMLDIINGVS